MQFKCTIVYREKFVYEEKLFSSHEFASIKTNSHNLLLYINCKNTGLPLRCLDTKQLYLGFKWSEKLPRCWGRGKLTREVQWLTRAVFRTLPLPSPVLNSRFINAYTSYKAQQFRNDGNKPLGNIISTSLAYNKVWFQIASELMFWYFPPKLSYYF